MPGDPVRRLEQEVGRLREAIRARDDFIAVAAHELRNPMTPVYGQVERLIEEARRWPDCPPALTQGLALLHEAIEVFVARATTLLDVTRISAGLRLYPRPLDLPALLDRVVRRYRRAAERVGSSLTLESGAAVAGEWDPVALEQIADNLLSNAVKYGGGAPITMALDADEEDVRISVRDRGVGISTADQARIFGRFEQAILSRGPGGLGIGLWVTRELVEAMGGRIAVDAAAGRGSTFTVTLPRHPPASREAS